MHIINIWCKASQRYKDDFLQDQLCLHAKGNKYYRVINKVEMQNFKIFVSEVWRVQLRRNSCLT